MRRVLYFIGEAFRGFYQAKLMTFVSIATVGVTLFFLGVLIVGLLNMQRWLTNASQESMLVAYLDESTGDDASACSLVVQRLAEFPQVKVLTVVGKEEAWRRFENLHGKDMLSAVDENPFPVSVEMSLAPGYQTAEQVDALRREIQNIRGIEGARYAKEWFERLDRIRRWFFTAAALVVPVLLLALHFMISNTVKLTIYARKELVTNMYFVGATDTYIKMPFILEGMIQGLIGGLVALAFLYAVKVGGGRMQLYWGPWYGSLIISGAGVIFGWIGSQSAVRKFIA